MDCIAIQWPANSRYNRGWAAGTRAGVCWARRQVQGRWAGRAWGARLGGLRAGCWARVRAGRAGRVRQAGVRGARGPGARAARHRMGARSAGGRAAGRAGARVRGRASGRTGVGGSDARGRAAGAGRGARGGRLGGLCVSGVRSWARLSVLVHLTQFLAWFDSVFS